MQLHNKTAIVTGAASGIGKEIARQFVNEGANVAIADLNLEAARAAAEDIDPGGAATLAVRMDVTDEARSRTALRKSASRFGGIDVLVSNAGIQIVSPVDQFEFGDWKKMLAIHLDGAFLTTRAALRRMYAQGRGGSILYIGSVHSKEASKLKAPYVTAKHGLIGLAKTVAKEGADHGVRANVICPGFVRTPLVEKQIPEQAKELGISEADVIRNVMLKETVDGEFTTLDDVARCAALPCSLPVKCPDRPVDRGEPRLVDAVISRTKRMNMPVSPKQLHRGRTRRLPGRPPFDCIALLLQGGGALGAYQGGVYQALAEAELHPDWVAGISIGAINAALIAGNPPESRVEKLRSILGDDHRQSARWLGASSRRRPFVAILRRKWSNQWFATAAILCGAPGSFARACFIRCCSRPERLMQRAFTTRRA